MAITLDPNWRDRKAWDDFVEAHEEGRFCQLFNYSHVVSCYGYRPVHLAFLKNRSLVAVLPSVMVRSLLFEKKLVSQPFSEYGGLLTDPCIHQHELLEIFSLLEDYLARHSIRSLEMHGAHGLPAAYRPGPFAVQNPHHVAVLALDRPIDQIWEKVVQYSVRKGVNKARAQGVEAFEACDAKIIRERFYPLYLKSMKRLGVPPHSLSYYLRGFELMGDSLRIFWARRDNEILAGLLGFACGGRLNIVNIVSTPESWKYAPNDLIHWEFIKWAAESGFKHFDFGSVRYEGQRTYKKKWGVAFEPHGYYLLANNAEQVPAVFELFLVDHDDIVQGLVRTRARENCSDEWAPHSPILGSLMRGSELAPTVTIGAWLFKVFAASPSHRVDRSRSVAATAQVNQRVAELEAVLPDSLTETDALLLAASVSATLGIDNI